MGFFRFVGANSARALRTPLVEAAYRSNAEKAAKAFDQGDYNSAYGYVVENKVMDEFHGKVLNSGQIVKFKTDRGFVKTDIDMETDTGVYQIKSGAGLMSPSQAQATIMYAEQQGKTPILMYNEGLVKDDNLNLRDLRQKYPQFQLVPRNDWATNPKEYFDKNGVGH